MSYYSGGASTETPQQALDRLWSKASSLQDFVRVLTWCDWADGWSKENYEEFNTLVVEKLMEMNK
jgi:hypothetical protein